MKRQLETRKAVERAKGSCSGRQNLTEEEAYLRMRNESAGCGRPMKDLAEAIILAEELGRKDSAAGNSKTRGARPRRAASTLVSMLGLSFLKPPDKRRDESRCGTHECVHHVAATDATNFSWKMTRSPLRGTRFLVYDRVGVFGRKVFFGDQPAGQPFDIFMTVHQAAHGSPVISSASSDVTPPGTRSSSNPHWSAISMDLSQSRFSRAISSDARSEWLTMKMHSEVRQRFERVDFLRFGDVAQTILYLR